MEEITIKYIEDIAELRKQREASRSRILTATTSLEHMLNALALNEGEDLVKWEDLRSTEIGMQLYVNEKVYFIKYMEDDEVQGFKVFLKAGGAFGIQRHDCFEETLVLQGNLIEPTRNHEEFTSGQTITYANCQLHNPYCTVDSVYKVVFANKGRSNCCKQ
jgi:hypothetical protein